MEPLADPFINLVDAPKDTAWVGSAAPHSDFHTLVDILDGKKDFRAPAGLHRSFAAIFLTETDLGTIKAWRLVLDEALRLLRPQGLAVLRLRESVLLSIFALKNFVYLWAKKGVKIELESLSEDGFYTVAFRFHLTSPPRTNVDQWTFGLVSDGRRPQNVIKFIQSVEAIQNLGRYEILICGPAFDTGSKKGVTFIDPPKQFDKNGWITWKKNRIVEKSAFENVLIAHDRYTLPTDFMDKMTQFGGDFDILTARQITAGGRRFPEWVTTSSAWNWTRLGVMEYEDFSPFYYLNGGLIIGKSDILRDVPWNELLFWAQAEDVELSRRLESSGYVHRMIQSLAVTVLEWREGYIEQFVTLPKSDQSILLPGYSTDLPFRFYVHDVEATNPDQSLSQPPVVKLVKAFLRPVRPQLLRSYRLLRSTVSLISPKLAFKIEGGVRKLLHRKA